MLNERRRQILAEILDVFTSFSNGGVGTRVSLDIDSYVFCVSDGPLSPMSGMASSNQDGGSGFMSDLRLVSLEKQLNIELKVSLVRYSLCKGEIVFNQVVRRT